MTRSNLKLQFLLKFMIFSSFSNDLNTCAFQTASKRHHFSAQQTPLFLPKTLEKSSTELNGIPKMFRWLTDQYPTINRRLSEGLTSQTLVDNFYLDMNGIIHPCTHGNAKDSIILLDERAMFQKIFGYVDRLYKLVKPRNILYLAVDGVAPRAKMNQQRSRRFRSGKESENSLSDLIASKSLNDDQFLDKLQSEYKLFDSNCITPGTDFMMKLSLAMEKWIDYKQQTDEFWKNGATVLFSGPDVPGEGEHKVMDYIREIQEEEPTHKTKLRHVLYGLDADLIMLGLVTHEPNFTLLREKMSVVMAGRGNRKNDKKKKDMLEYDRNDYELLELKVLRQMLSIQFRKLVDVLPNYNPERVVDDFVFLCMLVGNDFLPHVPHLEIDNGALNLMMSTYVDLLPTWKGYLTDKEKINPERFEHFMFEVAYYEQTHFERRSTEEDSPGFGKGVSEHEFELEEKIITQKATPEDFKQFHLLEPSYRKFYYENKLNNATIDYRRQHVYDYLKGLHWVLGYYHNGCPSWNWYFPYLYSPLATDMVYLRDFYDNKDDEFVATDFDKGKPLPSLAQLLSVLPPSSADLLPKSLAELMIHPSSPIAQFYPNEFETDPNGKRQPWEHVIRIPFVQEDLLMREVQRIENEKGLLTEKELRRNVIGERKHFVPENFDAHRIKVLIEEEQAKATNYFNTRKNNNNFNSKRRRNDSSTTPRRSKKSMNNN